MMLREAPDSPRRWCFACGSDNPEGLHIEFEIQDGGVSGRFQSRDSHQGYPGVMHGGVAAVALDEAMAWAAIAAGFWGTTAKMDVRFRRPLPLNVALQVTARVERDRGRWLQVVGRLYSADGELLVEANGLLQKLSEERAREMNSLYFLNPADDEG